MPFKNREEAGERLTKKLTAYKNNPDVMVIALPRGGVVLGRIIADALHAPLDIVVPRKIGAPDNEEYAIGALTENGDVIWNELEKERYPQDVLDHAVEQERRESKRRLETYRAGLPPRVMKEKIVILVDDGVATGYTILSAIKTIKTVQPKKLVVALPGGPADTIELLKREVNDVIALETPAMFWAVGQLYKEFPQIDDREVMQLLSLDSGLPAYRRQALE